MDEHTTTITALQATVRCTMAIRRIRASVEQDDTDDMREALLYTAEALADVVTCIQVMWVMEQRRWWWWWWSF